jgi:tetraacyldisaccharide 4'-kinase
MNGGARQRYLDLVSSRTSGPWPTAQRLLLRAASWPYGAAVRLRNALYRHGWLRSERAVVPVVSVGNLTVGGTGKTPCVEYVARFYREHDLRVAILSRGYGSPEGGTRNDEALVLEENLPDVPHLQGADRVLLARTAVEELESEVIVLDDGFQHRRLARAFDVVLVDATNPWGHGYLLPRGLMREPPGSLARAGMIVLTRCDQVTEEDKVRLRQRVARLAPIVPVAETTHRPEGLVNSEGEVADPENLRGRPVAAFCGLGNPEAFRRTLADLGADVRAFRAYPDHHPYDRGDVDELRACVRNLGEDCTAVTTQKDLVKLRLARLGNNPLWAVRIRLHFEAGRDALDRKLLSALGPVPRG